MPINNICDENPMKNIEVNRNWLNINDLNTRVGTRIMFTPKKTYNSKKLK